MTPSQKRQLKQALERYFLEYGPRWSKYHCHIKTKLKLADNDKRLHERDPRNWILDGIEPTEGKLTLYEQFIRKVYPAFEFLPEEISGDIDLGLAFACFTDSKEKIYSAEACKKAASYDGKLYTENKYWDDDRPAGHLLTLIALRHISGTPFLKALQLELYGSGNGNEKIDRLHDLFFSNEMMANREVFHQINADAMGLFKSRSVFLDNRHVGIIIVADNSSAFQGVMKTENAVPYHLILEEYPNESGFDITKIGRGHSYAFRENWQMCEEANMLKQIIYGYENRYRLSNAYQE